MHLTLTNSGRKKNVLRWELGEYSGGNTQRKHAAVAQRRRRCAAVMCCRGFDPGRGGSFSDESEEQKRPCIEISVNVKTPRRSRLNPEPFTRPPYSLGVASTRWTLKIEWANKRTTSLPNTTIPAASYWGAFSTRDRRKLGVEACIWTHWTHLSTKVEGYQSTRAYTCWLIESAYT